MNWNWPKLQIHLAEEPDHWSEAQTLFREYAESLDYELEHQRIHEEIKTLPGVYAAPAGCVLLAREGEEFVGCVALRKLEEGVCEMKRLYVTPDAQGRGIGRSLVHRVTREALGMGYKRMRLDTIPSMRSARRLYHAFGFREIESYRDDSMEGTMFMELMLSM